MYQSIAFDEKITNICFVFEETYRLTESAKITLCKHIIEKIIEAEVTENCSFFALFSDFELDYFQDTIFKKGYTLDDYDRPNIIVQMNGLHFIHSVIVI